MRGRLLVAIVFVVVWGLITHGTVAGTGDEPHYMLIARSLAFDRDLDLANDYSTPLIVGGGLVQNDGHAAWQDGRLRPLHDIGMPLVLAPVIGVAYVLADWLGDTLPKRFLEATRLDKSLLLRHQISLLMAFLSGLLARELFLLLRDRGSSDRHAFTWALLFALSPPILSYSFLFFTELPSALITLVAFRRLTVRPVRTPAMAAALGGLVGLLLLLHARNVGIVAGLVLVAALAARRTRSARTLAAFVAGVSTGALARGATTWFLWGTPFTSPLARPGAIASASETLFEIFTRATGLLFDREFGLLAYAPVYLLAAPGLILLARRGDPPARDLFVVMASYLVPVLLPMTNIWGWQGGFAPAARFLVPVAALLWVAVHSYAVRAVKAGRALVIALLAVQVAIDAYVWQFPKTLWNDGDGMSTFRWARWLPTWTAADAAPAFALGLCAIVVMAALTVRYARTADNVPQ